MSNSVEKWYWNRTAKLCASYMVATILAYGMGELHGYRDGNVSMMLALFGPLLTMFPPHTWGLGLTTGMWTLGLILANLMFHKPKWTFLPILCIWIFVGVALLHRYAV